LLWTFVDACARGRLPAGECSPVLHLAVIAGLLLLAVTVLAVLLLRRARK
jgi:hypothetical protein